MNPYRQLAALQTILAAILAVALAGFTTSSLAAPGDLDPTFDGDGKLVLTVSTNDFGSDVADAVLPQPTARSCSPAIPTHASPWCACSPTACPTPPSAPAGLSSLSWTKATISTWKTPPSSLTEKSSSAAKLASPPTIRAVTLSWRASSATARPTRTSATTASSCCPSASRATLGQDLTFTTPYDYATWAAEKFGAASTNETLAGSWANPEGDRWNNAAEFALGLNPQSPDTDVLQTRDELGRLTLTLTHPLDRAGTTLTFAASTNVAGPWQSGPGATALVNLTRDGNLEAVTVRTDFPGTQPRQFLRLTVQAAQP